ncbi:MAG: glycosyltransferase [Acidobacteriaceae bacterium]|nr:glycosyltransferase [Acidobacteriaceae bacterium]
MRLLIVSSTIHYRSKGALYAYAGYAREIEMWAELFSDVTIAAPLRTEPPPGDCVPFRRKNIGILPQKEVGGNSWVSKLKLLASTPGLLYDLSRAMREHDAVHVRCPGNLGLLGALVAPLLSKRIVAKYAGQWNGYPREPLTYRLQRRILASGYWRGPVTVYGNQGLRAPHVIPFFTSIMTERQVNRAFRAAQRKQQSPPLKILFVGRLSAAKNIDILLEALACLKKEQDEFFCSIVGEGPERGRLENLARSLRIAERVLFAGGLPYPEVLEHMEKSDILVLASETEGWPKAIVEAMTHGLVCVGSDCGIVPEILAGGRGVIVPVRDVDRLATALRDLLRRPEVLSQMGRAAAEWGRCYSLDRLRQALGELLKDKWGLPSGSLAVELRTESSGVLA